MQQRKMERMFDSKNHEPETVNDTDTKINT